MKQIEILGVRVNQVNIGQARDVVQQFIEKKERGKLIVTPNSEMIIMALENPDFKDILNQADLSIPDGAGVLLASRLLGSPLPERVAGFDLMIKLFSLAETEKFTLYLLGSKPGIVEEAVKKIKDDFPKLDISGHHHGYLDKQMEKEVIAEINSLNPDLLLVGMGVPLQERFLANNLSGLKVRVGMTVGGAFDVLAGRIKRAPLWMQRIHLEWLFRLIQEPRRFGRMLALPRFALLVLGQKLRKIFISSSSRG